MVHEGEMLVDINGVIKGEVLAKNKNYEKKVFFNLLTVTNTIGFKFISTVTINNQHIKQERLEGECTIMEAT